MPRGVLLPPVGKNLPKTVGGKAALDKNHGGEMSHHHLKPGISPSRVVWGGQSPRHPDKIPARCKVFPGRLLGEGPWAGAATKAEEERAKQVSTVTSQALHLGRLSKPLIACDII